MKHIRSARIFLATAVAVAGLAMSAPVLAQPQFAASDAVREYRLQVPQKRIDAVLAELRQVQFDSAAPELLDSSDVDDLRRYRNTRYDWRMAQQALNRHPQYLARIDGVDLPFYYVPGESADAPALLLTGPITQVLATVDRLARPSRHGGHAADAFSVIVPALPGSGFSSQADLPVDAAATAALWSRLVTEVIGHGRFYAYGEGAGSQVVTELGRRYAAQVQPIRFDRPLGDAAAQDALVTDRLLQRLAERGMEDSLQLHARAQLSADGDFWPASTTAPVHLARLPAGRSAGLELAQAWLPQARNSAK